MILTCSGDHLSIYMPSGSFDNSPLASWILNLVYFSSNFQKNPEDPELANMVAKNDANWALAPRFRQVSIESAL
ncbi:hypothetical protein TNCV_4972381 [Trichonephila clavipes]|nr:hypothetical protein TNCV_4972381 [Trichonephila clavipes]